jgi:hypothetical protein
MVQGGGRGAVLRQGGGHFQPAALPTRPTRLTPTPSRVIATASFAPLPPGEQKKEPIVLSPPRSHFVGVSALRSAPRHEARRRCACQHRNQRALRELPGAQDPAGAAVRRTHVQRAEDKEPRKGRVGVRAQRRHLALARLVAAEDAAPMRRGCEWQITRKPASRGFVTPRSANRWMLVAAAAAAERACEIAADHERSLEVAGGRRRSREIAPARVAASLSTARPSAPRAAWTRAARES